MYRTRLSRLLALPVLVALAGPARAEVQRVWATSDGDKVSRGDIAHPSAASNAIFDPASRTLRLFGLRNETVAFQVVVQGGASATPELRVDLPSIGAIENRSPSDDPDRYFVGRHIEIFEVREVEVERRSRDLVWLPGSDAQPDMRVGPIPDPLVPHRTSLELPAGENRVFWIDVWIPRDAPAGTQTGTVAITAGGASCGEECELKVELQVADHALPDEPAVRTMLFFSGGEPERKYVLGRYFAEPPTPEQRQALIRRHHQLARRHRVTLFWGKHERPEAIADRLSGTELTPERGYQGPGEGRPDDLVVLEAYGGELAPEPARRWRQWLDENAPDARALLYVVDEPRINAETIARINAVAADASPIESFVTTPFDPRIEIDVFAALAADFRRDGARAAEKAGAEQWIYNGVRPFTGTFAIDDVAISPRVNPWIQLAHDIGRWFYWEATYYNDFQGDRGSIDVWKHAGNFSNKQGDWVNGDGLLFYPGSDHVFPKSDLGLGRPLPSIRLKNWRRGIEDAGYVQLARSLGKEAEADAIVDALVGGALDRRRADEPTPWPEDGDSWLLARRRLFDLITGESSNVSIADIRRPPEPLTGRMRRELRRATRFLFGSPKRIGVSVAAIGFAALGLVLWRRRRRRA